LESRRLSCKKVNCDVFPYKRDKHLTELIKLLTDETPDSADEPPLWNSVNPPWNSVLHEHYTESHRENTEGHREGLP